MIDVAICTNPRKAGRKHAEVNKTAIIDSIGVMARTAHQSVTAEYALPGSYDPILLPPHRLDKLCHAVPKHGGLKKNYTKLGLAFFLVEN